MALISQTTKAILGKVRTARVGSPAYFQSILTDAETKSDWGFYAVSEYAGVLKTLSGMLNTADPIKNWAVPKATVQLHRNLLVMGLRLLELTRGSTSRSRKYVGINKSTAKMLIESAYNKAVKNFLLAYRYLPYAYYPRHALMKELWTDTIQKKLDSLKTTIRVAGRMGFKLPVTGDLKFLFKAAAKWIQAPPSGATALTSLMLQVHNYREELDAHNLRHTYSYQEVREAIKAGMTVPELREAKAAEAARVAAIKKTEAAEAEAERLRLQAIEEAAAAEVAAERQRLAQEAEQAKNQKLMIAGVAVAGLAALWILKR